MRVAGRKSKGSRPLIKIAVVLCVVAVLGFLMVRSAKDARSTPYTVKRDRLRNGTVALESASSPSAPMLAIRPQQELAADLFHQVFARNMESLNSPNPPAIPLVLKDEFDRAFAGHVTPEALLAAARSAGLDATALEPQCLAYRRVSSPGVTQQLYFAIFDAQAFGRFRRDLGAMSGVGAAFDPAALSPVLFIGASDPDFNRWLPLRADPKTDCVAPIVIE